MGGDHDAAVVLEVGDVLNPVRRAARVLDTGAEDPLEVAELNFGALHVAIGVRGALAEVVHALRRLGAEERSDELEY